MVVDQVHVDDLVPIEPERETPVAGYPDAPPPFPVAVKRMQPVPWSIDVAGTASHLEQRQRPTKPGHQVHGKATGIIVFRKPTQASVSYPQRCRLTRDGIRILPQGRSKRHRN